MNDLVSELVTSIDPQSVMLRIVEQVCIRMPSASGASISLTDGNGNLEVVATYGASASLQGRVVRVEDTFQAYPLRSGKPEIVNDVTDDPRIVADVRAIGSRLGVRSCLSMPLITGEAAFGTLSIVAQAPFAFDADHIARVSSITKFLGVLISSNSHLTRLLRALLEPNSSSAESHAAAQLLASVVLPDVAEREERRGAIDELLADCEIGAVFQPILNLANRELVAFEGLCRIPGDSTMRPDQWMALAHRVDRGVQLELKALRAVLDSAQGIPETYTLAVNLSPRAVTDEEVQEVLKESSRSLVVELTEHEPAPEQLSVEVEPLRQCGIRFAVDDAGSGFAGLTTILRLRPDIIKLDRELTAGLEADPIRRALAAALSHFAHETGAITVAEGIENDQQLQHLRDLGFKYGQGFALGRPQPVSELQKLFPEPR